MFTVYLSALNQTKTFIYRFLVLFCHLIVCLVVTVAQVYGLSSIKVCHLDQLWNRSWNLTGVTFLNFIWQGRGVTRTVYITIYLFEPLVAKYRQM